MSAVGKVCRCSTTAIPCCILSFLHRRCSFAHNFLSLVQLSNYYIILIFGISMPYLFLWIHKSKLFLWPWPSAADVIICLCSRLGKSEIVITDCKQCFGLCFDQHLNSSSLSSQSYQSRRPFQPFEKTEECRILYTTHLSSDVCTSSILLSGSSSYLSMTGLRSWWLIIVWGSPSITWLESAFSAAYMTGNMGL